MGELIRASDICKSFMGNQVLNHVSIALNEGECLALVGENGAGKSTLMKIISGIYSMDSGSIRIKGKPVMLTNPKDAQLYGISIIHQELNLIPNLSVAQNIFLGREIQRGGVIDDKKMIAEAKRVFESMQVTIDPAAPIAAYTVAEQQIVEIARVFSQNADIIIMDEPTAALSLEETHRLFSIIHNLKNAGKGIIYISHRLEEIYQVADRICVLRDGNLIETFTPEVHVEEVVEAMVGQSIKNFYPKKKYPRGEAVFEAQNCSDGLKFFDVSFKVHAGEVYGIAGLLGAGQTQLARAIYGLVPLKTGEMLVKGESVSRTNPAESIRRGVGMITEDRKLEGLVQRMSICENISLSPRAQGHTRLGVIQNAVEARIARESVEKYSIKSESVQQEVILLSGGNQQKVVLARALATHPEVIIMCEPTRGVDVNGKVEIYEIINYLLEKGKAIILVSSEIPEIIGMSDRIAVFNKGRIVAEMDNENLTQERVMYYATGGHERG